MLRLGEVVKYALNFRWLYQIMLPPELVSRRTVERSGISATSIEEALPLSHYDELHIKGYHELGYQGFPCIVLGFRLDGHRRTIPRPVIRIGDDILPGKVDLNLELYFTYDARPIPGPRSFTLITEHTSRHILHRVRGEGRMGYHGPELTDLSVTVGEVKYTLERQPSQENHQAFALTRTDPDGFQCSHLMLTFRELDREGVRLLPHSWEVTESNLLSE